MSDEVPAVVAADVPVDAAVPAVEPSDSASPEIPSPVGEEAAAPVEAKQWGAWGQEVERVDDDEAAEHGKQSPALADDLAVMSPVPEEDRQVITGPDGYQYPPLTKAGVDILTRLWNKELPANREQAVIQWERKVRCSVDVGLAIPVPPRVPATELLNRPAAAKRTTTSKEMATWIVEEDPEEVSEAMKAYRAAGAIDTATVTSLLEKRRELREERNYPEADKIASDLCEMGVEWNDRERKWRCTQENKEGIFAGGPQASPYSGGDGSSPVPQGDRPYELNDIDLPGSWEDFLALPDPKVLAVGPRIPANGNKRAWGAGGHNWQTYNENAAVEQAVNNCRSQGVRKPKIIWPPHLAGFANEPVFQGGKGGWGNSAGGNGGWREQRNDYGGKGGSSYGGKGDYGRKGAYNNDYNGNKGGKGQYNTYNNSARYS